MLRPSSSCSGSTAIQENCRRWYSEDDRHREELPEQNMVVDAVGQRIDRDVAERMVEEMADQIGEQHHPAGKADLPHANAAEELSDLLAR